MISNKFKVDAVVSVSNINNNTLNGNSTRAHTYIII